MSDELQIPAMTGARRPSYRVERPAGGLDAGTKRLLTFAGIAVVALLVMVGGWAMLNRGPARVPVIEADARPLRTKPDNPGGMQVAGADEQESGAAAMAPPPEAPAPLALRAQVQAARPVAPTPAPVPAPASTIEPRPAPHPVVAGTQVQLAAVETEAGARGEWQRLARKYPDMLGSRQLAVQKTEANGKVMWRVRTGGFADIAEATSFCGKLKAKGAGCSIATF